MTHAKGRIQVSFVCFNAYKLFNPSSSAQLGGTELQMHALATVLAEDKRFIVNFIVGDFGQSRAEQHGEITVISAFRLDKKLLNLLVAPLYFFRALRTAKPDIIISSPAGPEIGLLALYCFVFRNTKYIFRTASDIDCNGEKEKTFDALSGFLYRFGITHAHQVVTQHERQQSDMQLHYGKNAKIISNGYLAPKQTIPLMQRPHRILWVGSSRKVKRADVFFSLVQDFPEYRFDMALSKSGDRALYEQYKARAKRLPNLTFHGELLPEKATALIANSRILLGTSDYEGSPNTYIIASLYGTPVASLRVQCQGVCVGGDYEEMKLEIRKIMERGDYAEVISERQRGYARVHYDMKQVITNWISVIQEMYYSQTNYIISK